MVFLVALSSFTYADLEDGLIQFWKHDDATTDGAVSINSVDSDRNGTITNAITGEEGFYGESYKFDGATASNTFVNIGKAT